MPEKKVESGQIIFRAGDVADSAYVVLSGRVELLEVVEGHEVQMGVAESGHAFGELALFDEQMLRPYSARAIEPTELSGMGPEEFREHLTQCPKSIMPYLALAFEKMRAIRTRAKTFVQAVSETDIATVVIAPAHERMKAQFKRLEIPVDRLPFRIGGYPEGGEVSRRDQLHLSIAAQANPLQVSRQHCEIHVQDKGLVVTDLGSRFCTLVNGDIIGRGHGVYTAPLRKGENEIVLGPADGPYRISITCV